MQRDTKRHTVRDKGTESREETEQGANETGRQGERQKRDTNNACA